MQEHQEHQEQEAANDNAVGRKWLRKIRRARKAKKDYLKVAKEAYELYWLEAGNSDKIKFPLFWANTQIQHAAVLANAPKPEVRRRNVDAQGFEKDLATAIERAIDFQFDTQDLEFHLHQAVDDYLVAALGSARVHYDPVISYDEGGDPVAIVNQGLSIEHIPFNRIDWEPNKSWENVGWVSIKHMLTAEEFKDQFPGQPLPESPITGEGNDEVDDERNPDAAKYAPLYRLYEVWDKKRREIVVVAEGRDEPVEVRPDQLGVRQFYPMPRPMFMNLKKDELTPKPDYEYIKSQLQYVNRLTKRIDAITDAIKDVGFYDENFEEMERLQYAVDGEMIPLTGLAERLSQAGGGRLMDSLLAKLPLENMGAVLVHLREMREDAKQQIYEITGISDLARGATDADETATAQQIKGQWAGVRFGRKQKEVTRFCRDIVRIMGEIIAEHFEADVLSRMTGVEITEEMIAVLRDDVSRTFAIDIETDSTIAGDEQAERESRLEMLTAVTEFLGTSMEMVQAQPAAAPLVQQMLLFLVRSFKHGKQLEDEIQALFDAADPVAEMQQQLQEMQQQLEQGGAELQAAQEQLAQVNERQEGREDIKTQAEAAKDMAQAEKINREAMQPQVVPFPGM